MLIVSFVVALFAYMNNAVAQDGEAATAPDAPVVAFTSGDCCGSVPPGCYARPLLFRRAYLNRYCCDPCAVPCPPQPVCAPRPCCPPPVVCAPPAPVCDPCATPYGYGYRTPVRNFLGRVFAPAPYYGYPGYYY